MNNMLVSMSLTTLALLVLTGCAGVPSSVSAPECAECRDIGLRELKVHRSGRQFQSGSRLPRVHVCSCCKVEVTIYEKDGEAMLRCPKCAPTGIQCAACETGGSQEHTHPPR